MKHPSVSRIISVALALLTAIVATSTILGLRAQQYSNSSVDKVQREIRVILDIVDAINHTRTARTWLAQGALKLEQGDEASAFTYVAAAREKMKLSEASFQRYTDLKKDASEEKLAREFQDKYYYYKEKGIAPLITSLEMGNLRTYRTVLGSTTQMLDRTFEKSLDIVLNYRESKSKLLNESIKEKFRYDVAVICALAFSYFIGMVVIWRFSITMLSVPLNEMVNALEHVSKNDFTFVFRNPLKRMPYEIVLMRHSLSVMQAKLSQTVISISETAESVRRASSEISQATQDLARRTERQAHQFQTSAVALNNMSEELRNTTSVSGDVASVSTRAAVVANEGMQGVARVVHTMESIQSASERIDVIVSTIDSIAFQTNILALNAAVEAARAGNQGRGFAVVASEVRSLSKRSADAAAEIKRLINDITMRIGSGSIHAIEAGEIVKALVENVQSSAELISGVKVSITKQSEEITDLTAIMTRLDLMTQQNSAMVEQSAAATDSLRILADALADSMADFKPIKNAASVKGSGGLSVRLQFS